VNVVGVGNSYYIGRPKRGKLMRSKITAFAQDMALTFEDKSEKFRVRGVIEH
jgi:hypothetical protein